MSGKARLRLEFVSFFLVAPLVVAVFMPPRLMFPILFCFAAIGIILLIATPDFRLRDLLNGVVRVNWTAVAIVALLTGVIGAAVVQRYAPNAFLLITRNPQLMLMIASFYPFLSAVPQELVFRVLYFQRYKDILPRHAVLAVPLNACIFAFAHLMYWSWVVTVMTFAGGLIFAFSYRVRKNFPEAVILHAVAGIVLFAMGLGVFFYSGNVRRPF